MLFLWFGLGVLVLLLGGILCVAYYSYRMAFLTRRPEHYDPENLDIPSGPVYEPHREQMLAWMKETTAIPHTSVSITSYDGLKLWGDFFECAPGAPIELMFHGYRGSSRRDLCGGVQRCFAVGRSALIVDQRSCGRSEGKTITFGVKERKDCLRWIDFILENYGRDRKIILTGVSMGAATVLMATAEKLPPNVVGVIADCPYSSQRDIMKLVIGRMGLPPKLAYPITRLGALLFGHFRLEELSPEQAMKTCKIPVFFVHGEADDFVPVEMSKTNYEACAARKHLLLVPGAGHCLGYLQDPQRYIKELNDFFAPELNT